MSFIFQIPSQEHKKEKKNLKNFLNLWKKTRVEKQTNKQKRYEKMAENKEAEVICPLDDHGKCPTYKVFKH